MTGATADGTCEAIDIRDEGRAPGVGVMERYADGGPRGRRPVDGRGRFGVSDARGTVMALYPALGLGRFGVNKAS